LNHQGRAAVITEDLLRDTASRTTRGTQHLWPRRGDLFWGRGGV